MAGDREAFLIRVREAATQGRRYPVRTVGEFRGDLGYVGAGTDVVGRLASEIEAVGADEQQAMDALRGLIDSKFGEGE